MKLYFVAGESSGDTHGANLIRALRSQDPHLQCAGLGGTAMQAEGMRLDYDLAGDAIMGFTEVVKHFLPIRRLFLDTVARLREEKPDAVVLIDYPGFNIRLAKEAHALRIPVIYYISPQVWAWKKKRIHTLARVADLMLVIFPFEEKLYTDIGMQCRYVGHPLLDHIAAYQPKQEFQGQTLIGLLPGSRAQEIERLLAPMIETARGIQRTFPEAQFATPVVNERRAELVRAIAGDFPLNVRVGGMYDVLSAARFCMVASGTATLETALFGVPMVILYKVTPVTYWLARLLVDVRNIGMVNILAAGGPLGKQVIPEFIQHDATAERMLPVAVKLIGDTPERTRMLNDLAAVRETLGAGGASECAAKEILQFLKE